MHIAYEDAFVQALFDEFPNGLSQLARQAAFAVYRNTVMKGCIDALQANYPAVTRLMGVDWFRAAATAYVREHAPRSPLMVQYGAGFEDFLRTFEPAADLNYLPDVAALDRFWTECHIADNAIALADDALTGLAPEIMAASVLHPHPAARWRHFDSCPAFTIWKRNKEDVGHDEDLEWKPEGALMTRPGDAVIWTPLDAGACALLDSCARGDTLALAADACLSVNPHADLVRIIAALIERGAFVQITLPLLTGD